MDIKKEKIDITQITENIFICGLCWKSRTEILSERNNVHEFNGWLRMYFKENYMFYRFENKTNEDIFINVQEWELPDFDLSMVLLISKSVQGWLSLDKRNVCIFEVRGSLIKFLFYISAILRYNEIFNNCKNSCDFIIDKRYKHRKIENKTLTRYLEYFDDILDRQNLLDHSVSRLKQIIISKIPKMNDSGCQPEFMIFCNREEIKSKSTRLLIDENYIVVNFEDIVINGDVKIQLYHNENGNRILVFEISFNSLFLQQGIHRFEISDIIFPFSENIISRKIGNGFLVDVILIEENKSSKNLYNAESTSIGNLRILSEHLKRKADGFALRLLIQEGYNRTFSKLFLQMGYNTEEVKKLIIEKNQKERNLIINQNNINKLPNIDANLFFNKSSDTSEKSKDDINIQFERISLKKPFQKRDYLDREWCDSEDIEILPDKLLLPKSEKIEEPSLTKHVQSNIKVAKGPPKRRINIEKVNDLALTSKKTLHWNPLTSIKDTFFTKLDDINIIFDQNKFEEWFCELATSREKIQTKKRQKSIIKNENRIFLILISLKTLEKKNIDIYDLESVIYDGSFDLETDDLESILRILPTEDEIKMINNYLNINSINEGDPSSIEDLNEADKFLIAQKDKISLRKTVEILIFERRILEEQRTLKASIYSIKLIYNNILESFNLLILLKIILEAGNLINYKYSHNKFRRKINGFKVSSFESILSYKGKKNENSLISFIFLTLQKEKPEVFNIFDELRGIHKINNDDFLMMKENINNLIREYKKCRKNIEEIKNDENFNNDFKKFLGFAYESIKELCSVYKEIIFLSEIIKRKFGEEKDIHNVVENLSSFITKLEEEHNKMSI